jgi:1,4-dihydroxy-2-naphthoate octaprenyltransferase
MNSKHSLLKVARPQFLIGGLALYALGGLWAVLLGAPFSPIRFLLGYLAVISAQLAVHYSNDYFDVGSDRPGGETFISGGAGVLIRHPELREPAKWIALGLTLFSMSMALLLMRLYSSPFSLLAFVILANLIGWFYSAPPLRLSSRGLGELGYALVGGFLTPSVGYLVMNGKLDLYGIFFIIPLTLYGLASIVTLEIPDVEDDRLANKRNWIVRGGRGFGFIVSGISLLAATAYFFAFPGFSARQTPLNLSMLGFFSLLPLAVGTLGILQRPNDRKRATQMAIAIMAALVLFAVLVDGYLIYLIVQQ